MATVALTLGVPHGHTTPNAYARGSAAGKQVLHCIVPIVGVAGTYASAGDATASAVGAAIAASRRDGRTVTILRASMLAPGKKADTTTVIGFGSKAVPGTTSADQVVGQLTTSDLETEHADGALTETFSEPIQLGVTYEVSS